jgi:hypothetical protein
MKVYREHLRRLDAAVATRSPILTLPPLHPEYLRVLLGEWSGAEGHFRDVRLIEPGVGSSRLHPGTGAIAAGCATPDLRAWLLTQLETLVPPRPTATPTTLLFWITGSDRITEDPELVGLLSAYARRVVARGLPRRLLLDAELELPTALRPWCRPLELPAPRAEVEAEKNFGELVLRDRDEAFADQLAASTENEAEGRLDALARGVRGLDAAAINLVIDAALEASNHEPDEAIRIKLFERAVRDERRHQMAQASGLELVPLRTGTDDALVGMNRFRRYLEYVKVLFDDLSRPKPKERAPRPRGVLLVGLPGCGKSLAARATAQELGIPLVRMDVGALMGRYLGESEAKLARALDAAEATAPCVLWVDEIEKTLGGLGSGSEGDGTGKRMLAHILTWMQEHDSQVYVFATANGVATLPPELLRRGRFDELWRVLLPDENERGAILVSKLNATGDDVAEGLVIAGPTGDVPGERLLPLIRTETKDFTGADISALVQEAWMLARVFERKIDEHTLRKVLEGGFVPMSLQFSHEIEASKKHLEAHGFRDVSCPDDALPAPVRDERKQPRGRLVAELGEVWHSGPETHVEIAGDGWSATLTLGDQNHGVRSGRLVPRASATFKPISAAEPGHTGALAVVLEREGDRLCLVRVDDANALVLPSPWGKTSSWTLAWDVTYQSVTLAGGPVRIRVLAGLQAQARGDQQSLSPSRIRRAFERTNPKTADDLITVRFEADGLKQAVSFKERVLDPHDAAPKTAALTIEGRIRSPGRERLAEVECAVTSNPDGLSLTIKPSVHSAGGFGFHGLLSIRFQTGFSNVTARVDVGSTFRKGTVTL